MAYITEDEHYSMDRWLIHDGVNIILSFDETFLLFSWMWRIIILFVRGGNHSYLSIVLIHPWYLYMVLVHGIHPWYFFIVSRELSYYIS